MTPYLYKDPQRQDNLTTRIVGKIKRKAYIHTERNTIKMFRLLQNLFHALGFVNVKHRLKAISPREIQSAYAFTLINAADIPHNL